MSTVNRLVKMILRGKTDQFKTVMMEELEHRVSILMEKMYKAECDSILKIIPPSPETTEKDKENKEDTVQISPTIGINLEEFLPESTYYLRDGNIGILNDVDKKSISKLYEKLNTDNRERLLKLLSESKESFNRVLNLAKIESKK